MIYKYGPARLAIVLLLTAGSVYGQQSYRAPANPPERSYPTSPSRSSDPYGVSPPGYQQPGYTQPPARQPVGRSAVPSDRQFQRNSRPPVPQAPFRVTQAEQDYINRVLAAWEQYSDNVKTFEADFTLRTYGSVFQDTEKNQQPVPKLGKLKYEKPDKGYFEVTGEDRWICDGISLFEYDFLKKEMIQHVLPPEERGKSIQNGPLPFIFGAKAATLKRRYWIRAIPSKTPGQIWMQAYPKYARDAADFCRVEMIVSAKDMHPIAIQMHLPNGKTTKTYVFENVEVNKRNSFIDGLLGTNPFKPKLPRGWTKIVKQPQAVQANAGREAKR